MLRLFVYFLIFASGVLLGSVFPSYGLQYQQRLQSRLEQVVIDLEPFQDIAGQYHDGSLSALIEHHLQSDDPTFYAEGRAIQSMLYSKSELASASAALNGTPWSQLRYFVQKIDYPTAAATWRHYQPSILLTPESMRFSVAAGAVFCLLCYVFWRTIRLLIKSLYRAR